MTDRPDLEGQDLRAVDRSLADYADATEGAPAPGFADWVMRSVAGEPLPRRGALAGLGHLFAIPGPYRRAVQVAAVAIILVAGIGSAAVLGQIIDQGPEPTVVPSPTPLPSPDASPSRSPEPSLTPSAAPSPTEAPEPSIDLNTPEPSDTPRPSETPGPS